MKFSNRLIKKILFIFILITGFSLTTNAQNVAVTATVGTSSASYATLGSGFSAINSGTHKGVITISITANTSESTSGAILNASGSGSASYTSIRITPSGARTVSAAVTAGTALIAFNGADNVTIDGLNSGGNSLTFSNTTASATAGTSTFRFYGDATSNKITNCTILGSSTMATTTNGGTIWFDASAVTVGNDNDTISNCNIGPAGSNLPTKSIYAYGTTTSTAKYNSGVVISGNNIYDYFNVAAQSNGIYISAGNTGWTLASNKFYQTASRTQTTGCIHAAINIASALGNENMQITGNTIGYSSSTATGTYTFVGVSSASKFYPIYISAAPATGVANSIQGNTITAISMSGPFAGEGYYDLPPFAGIYIGDDTTVVNIGTVTGNLIGSKTTSGAITFTSSATTLSDVYGIFFFPISNATINNNSVGGMTISNSSTGPIAFYGIRAFTWINYVNIMRNDTVGFTAAPIRISASSSSSKSIGILSDFGTPIITNSMVSNISMDGANVSTGTSSAMTGICADRASYYYIAALNALNDSILNVSGNVVHSLSNSSSAAVIVNGLVINGDTSINECVSKNYIHSLSVSNTSATINGINILSSNANYYNNMIRLGVDASGTSITTACKINGINETSGANNFYFNSVYIGGTGVGTTANTTFALNSTVITSTRKYRNNIFQNSRSNASTGGKHYAVKVGGTGTNPTGLTINNNIYYASGAGGVLGNYNSADVTTLATWKSTVGQDVNSFMVDPGFKDATSGATTVDLHLQSLANRLNPGEGTGAAITGYNDDYDGQSRSLYTPSDIGADAGNFLSFTISYTNLSNGRSDSTTRTTQKFASITSYGVCLDTLSKTKPRLYYKKSTDGNTIIENPKAQSNGWKYVEASGTSSPFDFSVLYSNLKDGSVSRGDTIQYFVVAQDMATIPNVYCNPSAGFSGSAVGNITSGPTRPNYYVIESPIVGVKSTGITDTTWYANLGNAFAAINAGTHTGNVNISIVSNTTETASGAILNASGSGSASYTSLKITPRGNITVSAAVTAGSPLIGFNGADNVTIDGLNSGSNSLTISNTTVSNTAGTSTIRFYSDATNNKITNCYILGSSTMATTTNGGVIWFDSSAVSVGNDNDTISNCNIGPAGSNLPTKCIYAWGTTTSTAKYNSGIVISGNNIYDYFNAAAQSNGIYIGAGNANWTITNNKFYQTATRTQTTGDIHAAINVASATGNDNMSITQNTIGYANSNGTGTYTLGAVAGSKFYPIYISDAASTGVANSIQGNTITAISISGATAGERDNTPFAGIMVKAGLANIGTTTGNLIGSRTSSRAIIFSGSATTLSDIYGISYTGTAASSINNNSIGGITLSNSSTGGIGFYGIRTSSSTTVTNTVQYDTIGFANGPITNTATTSNSRAVGICSQIGNAAVTNCIVRKIYIVGANTGTDISSSLIGILADGTTATTTPFNISNNTVYSLINSASAAVVANGIVYNGPASSSNVVSKNLIYSIAVSNASATINGINSTSGNATFSNNRIRLGNDTSGANLSTACKIYGICAAGAGTTKYYYNTIYMNGTAGSGSSSTIGMYRSGTETIAIKNNLLYNERTGGSGTHTAIGTINSTNFSADYNLYITTDTSKVGNYNGTNYNFSNWKRNSSGDNSSWCALNSEANSDSLFTDKNSPNLTIRTTQTQAWYVNGKGIAGTQSGSISTDFDGQARSTTYGMGTDIGSDEFTPTTTPPMATQIGTIANNQTTRYIFAGREIANIKWKNASAGTTTTFPSAILGYYYSGTNPPDPTNGGKNPGAKFMNCYYVLHATGGVHFLYDVTLTYDEALLGTLQSESDIKLGKKPDIGNTGDWKVHYGSSVNTTTNTLQFESLNGFSVFAMSDNTSALPVSLIEFTAGIENENVLLKWQSVLEINSSHYNIMRSVNGIDYEKIGTVGSIGNSNNKTSYSYTDENAVKQFEGSNVYYKLEMVDLDGTAKFSPVRTVLFKNALNINSMTPYFSDDNLNIKLKLNDDTKLNISLVDINGRLVYTNNGQYAKGSSIISLNGIEAPVGIYFVKMESATETVVVKVYKK